MKRNKLVVIEAIITITIVVEMILLVFSLYPIFNNMGRYVLKINNNNRLEVENMLKTSKYYIILKIQKIQKIQNFFLTSMIINLHCIIVMKKKNYMMIIYLI